MNSALPLRLVATDSRYLITEKGDPTLPDLDAER